MIKMTDNVNFKIGPAGLGGINEAIDNLHIFHKNKLSACEIAFTYGVYIKKQEDAEKIGNEAKKLGIQLSIHAPYWINLNSEELKKIQDSKKRIIDCCKIGNWLGAKVVVFHPGYYGKSEKEKTYEQIRKEILEIKQIIRQNNWKIELAPETTGKINVFGSIDEIARLAEDCKCWFCLDFAHILARYKIINWKYIFDKFKDYKEWHVHFSGIDYNEKGERNHKLTEEKRIKELIENLQNLHDKNITIINESPDPFGDSVKTLKYV